MSHWMHVVKVQSIHRFHDFASGDHVFPWITGDRNEARDRPSSICDFNRLPRRHFLQMPAGMLPKFSDPDRLHVLHCSTSCPVRLDFDKRSPPAASDGFTVCGSAFVARSCVGSAANAQFSALAVLAGTSRRRCHFATNARNKDRRIPFSTELLDVLGIAGVQPAAPKRGRGGVGLVEVPEHDVIPSCDDFTDDSGGVFVVIGVDGANFNVSGGPTTGTMQRRVVMVSGESMQATGDNPSFRRLERTSLRGRSSEFVPEAVARSARRHKKYAPRWSSLLRRQMRRGSRPSA
jgi:hypothetical protein